MTQTPVFSQGEQAAADAQGVRAGKFTAAAADHPNLVIDHIDRLEEKLKAVPAEIGAWLRRDMAVLKNLLDIHE